MKKIYKAINQENGIVTFYGSNRAIKTDYRIPEWSEEEEVSFRYQNRRYFISEFMSIGHYMPEYMQEFHGYTNDSFFSGIAIKFTEDGDIKAFTFIG